MLIVANWKAYVASEEKARKLFTLAKRLAKQPKIKIALAPPAPYLGLFASFKKSKIWLAAQDVSEATGGAETGEVPAQFLSGLGVSYVIIGHSERRARGETLEAVAVKMQRASAQGLKPILCIGEKERDHNAAYLALLRQQITSALEPLTQKERMSVTIAYEPVWAIGKSAADAITPPDLHEMVLYIRKVLADLVPGRANARIPILYGGSAEAGNIRLLAAGSGIDGFLVGHASADPEMFSELVRALA
ncbi:MAG: triose-phosphate isomerase [bacterium]